MKQPKTIEITPVAKRSKYKNIKTEYNGFKYDSKKEAAYAHKLDLLRKAQGSNQVSTFIQQQPLEVWVNGKKICKYIVDFIVKYADDRTEYVDVKGFKTSIYRLKKKLVEAQYGITIKEV